MIHLSDITTPLASFLAKSDALQRWNAVRNPPSGNDGWLWLIVTATIVLLSVVIVVPLVLYFRKRLAVPAGASHSTPVSASRTDASLTAFDVELLTRLIRQSGFIRPEMEFTLQHAFNVGMANYVGSDAFFDLPGEQRRDVTEKIEVLRTSLDIKNQEYDEKTMTTRNIPVGTQITVTHIGLQDDFGVVVRDNSDEGLRVQPVSPLEYSSDPVWTLRYYDGAKVWEFTSSIAHQDDAGLVMKHTDDVKPINFRRFVRVPVECSAEVCPFAFHPSSETRNPPKFVQADVVEIGGPGIMFKTTLSFRVGERILVMLDLGQKGVIQAVGKIRRVHDPDPITNWNRYGAELVGLKPSQVAELMHATNSAAIRHRKGTDEDLSNAFHKRNTIVTA